MRGQWYRLKKSTLAIKVNNGRMFLTSIPAGSEIEVLVGTLNGDRLLDVQSEGKSVRMFSTDIREYGKRITLHAQRLVY